ncbi:MAG: MaoC family dehydratase N-terminal domain-containing protein [Dehalococcoidia bacterium]
MAEESHITDEARSYLGRTGPVREFQVTARDIVRFAMAIGDKNPLWRDEAYAKQTSHQGLIAPPMFHCVIDLDEEDLDELEESGLGKNMGLRMEVPVPGFPGAMATGREIEFGEPIRPGDTIKAQETLVDLYEKQGRRGPLVFVISEKTYTNQRGELVLKERRGLIRHQ